MQLQARMPALPGGAIELAVKDWLNSRGAAR